MNPESDRFQGFDPDDTVPAPYRNIMPAQQARQCSDNLARILRSRKDALIFLHGERDPFRFEPAAKVRMVEDRQDPLHQAFSTGIDGSETPHLREGVRQVATAASGNGNLRERRPVRLEERHIDGRRQTFEMDGAEAARSAGPEDCHIHVERSFLQKYANIQMKPSRNPLSLPTRSAIGPFLVETD
jgi:hypothetical protein